MSKHLSFCHRPHDGYIGNLESDSLNDISTNSGVYIISSERKSFAYPSRNSPIIYIGQAQNLKARLSEHKYHLIELKGNFKKYRNNFYYYSRYQYFAAFGAKVHYLTTRGKQHGKNLENKVILAFYRKYGALPVGNGAFSWKKL